MKDPCRKGMLTVAERDHILSTLVMKLLYCIFVLIECVFRDFPAGTAAVIYSPWQWRFLMKCSVGFLLLPRHGTKLLSSAQHIELLKMLGMYYLCLSLGIRYRECPNFPMLKENQITCHLWKWLFLTGISILYEESVLKVPSNIVQVTDSLRLYFKMAGLSSLIGHRILLSPLIIPYEPLPIISRAPLLWKLVVSHCCEMSVLKWLVFFVQ